MWFWLTLWGRVDVRLRPAQIWDAPRLARLHAESFAFGWSGADFEAMLADKAILADVLVSQGVFGSIVTGFAISRVAADEAELLTIALDGEVRGKGLSRRLLLQHAQRLRQAGAEKIFLEVAEDNAAALALYNRIGFVETGRRVGYYATGLGKPRKTALTFAWDIASLDPTPRF